MFDKDETFPNVTEWTDEQDQALRGLASAFSEDLCAQVRSSSVHDLTREQWDREDDYRLFRKGKLPQRFKDYADVISPMKDLVSPFKKNTRSEGQEGKKRVLTSKTDDGSSSRKRVKIMVRTDEDISLPKSNAVEKHGNALFRPVTADKGISRRPNGIEKKVFRQVPFYSESDGKGKFRVPVCPHGNACDCYAARERMQRNMARYSRIYFCSVEDIVEADGCHNPETERVVEGEVQLVLMDPPYNSRREGASLDAEWD